MVRTIENLSMCLALSAAAPTPASSFSRVDEGRRRGGAHTRAAAIDQPAGETRLRFYDLATGKSTTITRNLGEVGQGLTASPDGSTILYTRFDAPINDLMLVENFR